MKSRFLTGTRSFGVATGLALAGLGLSSAAVSAAPPPPPTVTGVNPNNGPTSGGTTVTISGSNFKGVTGVSFGSTAGTVVSITRSTVVATSPAESAGTVDVTVTTTHGTSSTSPADQFTYNAPPTTTVSSISPTSGPTVGGTSVMFTGTFSSPCSVSFGGVAASASTFVSPTEIDATSPGYFPPGVVPAEVTCGSSSDAKPFTYVQATGTSWSLLPGSAHDIASGGGATFVIGTNAVPGGFGVYRWTATGWAGFSGGLVDIAVGHDGNPWGINAAHEIWQFSAGSWHKLPGSAYDIAVGPGGTAFVLGTNSVPGGWGIWRWSAGAWSKFSGGATHIAVGAGDNPWVTNSTNQIYSYSSGWNLETGSAVNVAANANSVWVLGTNSVPGGNGLWYDNGSGWSPIPGGAVSIATGADSLPFVTNSANQIYHRV